MMNKLMQLPHLQKLIRLPSWQQYGLIAALTGLIFLYFVYVELWPKWQSQATLKTEITAVEQKVEKIQGIYQSLTATIPADDELTEMNRQLAGFNQINNNPAQATEIINRYLGLSGCRLLTLKTQPEKQSNDFIVHQWRLQILGSYPQIIHFLTLFSENSALFAPEAINISQQDQLLRLDLTLNLYLLIYP